MIILVLHLVCTVMLTCGVWHDTHGICTTISIALVLIHVNFSDAIDRKRKGE